MRPKHLQPQDRDQTMLITSSRMWETPPSPDLPGADQPLPQSWSAALRSQGAATMRDHREEQLMSQAPDALRQMGIDPTIEQIETWVVDQLRTEQERSSHASKTT